MNTPNPFTYGNPITEPGRFFGRRREVELIVSRLLNPEFEGSSIVGERRLGKTSLLYYVSHPEVLHRFGLDPKAHLFTYVDLGIFGPESTPARLYQHLLRRIASRIQDTELREHITEFSHQDTVDIHDMIDSVEAINRKDLSIVLLMDEFETIGNNTNFGTDFYSGLRSLAIHNKLAYVTASRRDLVEMGHLQEIRSSPFFNIFATVNLQPFTGQEIEELLHQSLARTGISFSHEDVEFATKLAGPHPYFLQMAFWFLFDSYQRGLDRAELREFAESEFLRQAGPQFETYWQVSDDENQRLLALLALLDSAQHGQGRLWSADELQTWHNRASSRLNVLTRRGIVTRIDDAYALFSTAFSRWIVEEITTPSPSMVGDEGQVEEEKQLLLALPAEMARRVRDWGSRVNTSYRSLFLRWLSDLPTNEALCRLLTEAGGVFQEIAVPGTIRTPQGQVGGIGVLLVHHDELARQGLRRMLEEYGGIMAVREANTPALVMPR